MRLRSCTLGLLAAVGLLAASAGSAFADATVGQTGSDGSSCSAPDVQWDTGYIVPAGGGRITSFRFLSGASNAGQQLDFVVLRPSGGGAYSVVGKSGVKTLAGTGLETFPVSDIGTQAGDVIGFWNPIPLSNCGRFTGADSSVFVEPATDPNVGSTVAGGVAFGYSLNESATLVTQGTTVVCSSYAVRVGHSTTCKATVTGGVHPSGTVAWSSNSSGTFGGNPCTLVPIGGNQSSCTVTYTPTLLGSGAHKLYANYSGDANNPVSHSSTTITVTP